jgi:hypothetical protein
MNILVSSKAIFSSEPGQAKAPSQRFPSANMVRCWDFPVSAHGQDVLLIVVAFRDVSATTVRAAKYWALLGLIPS